MIDHVAQAILAALDKEEVFMKGTIDYAVIDGSVDLRIIARAAIEAMREPTPKMGLAFTRYWHDNFRDSYVFDDTPAKECWQDMIDAALATEPAE